MKKFKHVLRGDKVRVVRPGSGHAIMHGGYVYRCETSGVFRSDNYHVKGEEISVHKLEGVEVYCDKPIISPHKVIVLKTVTKEEILKERNTAYKFLTLR